MSDFLIDLALPRTDAGVLVQLVVVTVAWVAAVVALRRNRDLVLFSTGIALLLLAWFGLRATH